MQLLVEMAHEEQPNLQGVHLLMLLMLYRMVPAGHSSTHVVNPIVELLLLLPDADDANSEDPLAHAVQPRVLQLIQLTKYSLQNLHTFCSYTMPTGHDTTQAPMYRAYYVLQFRHCDESTHDKQPVEHESHVVPRA